MPEGHHLVVPAMDDQSGALRLLDVFKVVEAIPYQQTAEDTVVMARYFLYRDKGRNEDEAGRWVGFSQPAGRT